jgi:enamine deaminase RidA (YjgF/YER057c/UK114 family)
MTHEERLASLGLTLPPPQTPAGTYVPVVVVGNIAYVSGHGPIRADGSRIAGLVGGDLSLEEGQQAARQVGLCILSTLRHHLGSLDRVVRLVKVLGLVHAAPGFERHPSVVNGFSDLMVEVFGEAGRGARSAVGAGTLPFNIAVEVEAIFQIEP